VSDDLKLRLRIDADAGAIKAFEAAAVGAISGIRAAGDAAGSALDKAFKALNVRPSSEIRAEIDRLRKAYAALGESGAVSAGDLSRANEALRARISALKAEMGEAGKAGDGFSSSTVKARDGADSLGRSVGLLTKAFIAYQAAQGAIASVSGLVNLADAYTSVEGRLRLVTSSSEDLVRVQEALRGIAERSRATYLDTASVFARFASAVQGTGVSEEELLSITETLNKAFVISGSTTSEASAAMQQLSQGFASGVLRGDEFNSVMESGGRIADLLASHLGVSKGELRKMAEEGRLTADVMRGAFAAGAAQVNAEFERMPVTVGQAVTGLRDAFGNMIDEWNRGAGATEGLAGGILLLRDNLREAVDAGIRLAEAGLALAVAFNLDSAIGRINRLADAITDANLAMSGLQKASLVVASAFAGWEIGQWLNNFESVRKAGISLVLGLERLAAALAYGRDAMAAPFTSDTLEAAAERYAARIAEIDRIGTEMWLDAEKGAKAAEEGLQETAGAAAEVAAGLGKAASGAKDVKSALEELDAEAAFSGAADGIAKIGAALADARKAGAEPLAEAIEGISDRLAKMTAGELASFSAALDQAFGEGRITAEDYLDVVDRALPAAFKKLGIDSARAASGVSAEFSGLVSLLSEVAGKAVVTGAEIAEAVDRMRSSAKGADEFRVLSLEVQALGESGRLAGDELDRALRGTAKGAVDALYAALEKAADAASVRRLRDDLDELYQAGAVGARQYKESVRDLDAALARVTATQDMTRAEAEAAAKMADYEGRAREAASAAEDLSSAASGLAADQAEQARLAGENARALEREAEALAKAADAEDKKWEAARKQLAVLEGQAKAEKARLDAMQASGEATQAELNLQLARVRALEASVAASRAAEEAQRSVALAASDSAKALAEEAIAAREAADGLAEAAREADGASSAITALAAAGGRSFTGSFTHAGILMRNTLEEISEHAALLEREVSGLFASGDAAIRRMASELEDIDLSSIGELNAGLAQTEDLAQRISEAYTRPKNFDAGFLARIRDQALSVIDVMRGLFEESRRALELGEALDALMSTSSAALGETGVAILQAGEGIRGQALALRDWIAQAETAIASARYLDSEQLDNLRAGIEQAREGLADLAREAMAAKDALSDAAASFEEQILRLRGDEARLEELRYLEDLARLDELSRKAGANAEAEYAEARRLADELHALKLAQIEERLETEMDAAKEAAAFAPGLNDAVGDAIAGALPPAQPPPEPEAPPRVVSLRLSSAALPAETATLQLGEEDYATFLRLLESAGMRAA